MIRELSGIVLKFDAPESGLKVARTYVINHIVEQFQNGMVQSKFFGHIRPIFVKPLLLIKLKDFLATT